LIEPSPGHLEHVEAVMPHPMGNIDVKYNVEGNQIEATIRLPEGLNGTFSWKGRAYELISGEQSFTIN